MRMKYFAYGSNLLSARLRGRTPSAAAIGVATLSGYALRWHKRSRDGSGKCDAFRTGASDDAVVGVLFELTAADGAELDRIEGIGFGYGVRDVSVALGAERSRAFTYVARPDAIDASLAPYDWYKELVVAGAREHALPGEYLACLLAQACVADVDEARARKAWELIP